jgi:hypothetical protein
MSTKRLRLVVRSNFLVAEVLVGSTCEAFACSDGIGELGPMALDVQLALRRLRDKLKSRVKNARIAMQMLDATEAKGLPEVEQP